MHVGDSSTWWSIFLPLKTMFKNHLDLGWLEER
jgi:hypothetical protein